MPEAVFLTAGPSREAFYASNSVLFEYPLGELSNKKRPTFGKKIAVQDAVRT
jgi:hypothetical protein